MFAELETARLNVEDKSRSNLFSWRGQFTPQFVDYLLETFAHQGQTVLDPFCGSGTVLQEATSHRLLGIGLEINPAAYAMAKFFSFSGLDVRSRQQIVKAASELLGSVAGRFAGLPLFDESSDYRESASNLLDLARDLLSKTEDKQIRLLLLLSLFRAESTRNGNLTPTVARVFEFLSARLLQLPTTDRAPVAVLSDARQAHLRVTGGADLIITSPPYINVFNYHQNYRALLELVGFDMLRVAHSEIGSNRKHRGNRFLTVIQYCLDIEQALFSFANSLVPNGLLIMVLGRESRVRGIAFGNSAIVSTLIERNRAFSQPTIHERVFVNRFGQSIFEDILVARRIGNSCNAGSARDLATLLLRKVLPDALGDVRTNIEEALSLSASISPSPLFDKSAVI
jgi:SAM-dependent methyltransferase